MKKNEEKLQFARYYILKVSSTWYEYRTLPPQGAYIFFVLDWGMQ